MKKQKIINRTRYWQNKLGLNNWKINIVFENFKRPEDDDIYVAIAKTDIGPTYLLADITFKKLYLDSVNDGIIIHELLHVVMSEIVSYFVTNSKDLQKDNGWDTYFEEKTVTTLERIITRLHKV